jgi:transketolase
MIKTPGVEMSTGALGHGISIGLGMALAAKVMKKNYWTFIIVGDGCLNEGQSWEGIMAAAKFNPSRLVIMVDYNRVQLDGPAPVIMPLDPLTEKLKAFNLTLAEKIYDGHSVEDILESWQWMQENQKTPVAIVYKTHKGKGISFTEDESKWHGAPIDMESWKKGRKELLENLEKLEKLKIWKS